MLNVHFTKIQFTERKIKVYIYFKLLIHNFLPGERKRKIEGEKQNSTKAMNLAQI